MVYFAKQQARSWHKIPIGNRILESDSLPLSYHVGYQYPNDATSKEVYNVKSFHGFIFIPLFGFYTYL